VSFIKDPHATKLSQLATQASWGVALSESVVVPVEHCRHDSAIHHTHRLFLHNGSLLARTIDQRLRDLGEFCDGVSW
jgi:hypothetical protein